MNRYDDVAAQAFFVLVLTLGLAWTVFLIWAIYTVVKAVSGAL